MAVTHDQPHSYEDVEHHLITMSADADAVILSAINAKKITISVLGITADEIKVYGSVFTDDAKLTEQILDENDLSPFIADKTLSIIDLNLSKIKIVRAGAVDGIIEIAVNFQK